MDDKPQSYWWGIQRTLAEAIDLLKQVRFADQQGYSPSDVTREDLPLGDIMAPLSQTIDDFIRTHGDD